MLSFDRLQAESREWSERNFPNNTPDEPFMGVVEEIGELTVAYLADSSAESKDAIADITIYLSDYCNRSGFRISDILDCKSPYDFQSLEIRIEQCPFFEFHVVLGKWAHARLKSRQGIRGNKETHISAEKDCIKGLFVTLAKICNNEQYDFQEIVTSTWNQVKQRDWTKNRVDGSSPATAPQTARCTMPYEN